MAIYSFNHDTFGKTTNRAGAAGDNAKYNADLTKTELANLHDATRAQWEETGRPMEQAAFDELLADAYNRSAAANIAYNARTEATYATRSHVIPEEPNAAQAWFRREEANDRKNARMSDRFIGALPRELTPEQCIEAVEGFCREVTGDRIPWHFALHLELDKKADGDWNPHTHIIFRDRDIETGRRHLYTSAGPKERRQLDAKGVEYWTTKDFREAWSDHLNRALERAGHDARVDYRTLEAQGIDRTPGIHVGPGGQHAAEKGHTFESKDIDRGRRTIPYTVLDDGTRADHLARIKAENDSPQLQPTTPRARALARDLHVLREGQTEARQEQRDEQALDRAALHEAHKAERTMHTAWAKALRAEDRKGSGRKPEQTRAIIVTASHAMRVVQLQDRQELSEAHKLESAALFRAHAAERLAVTERNRAESQQSTVNAIAAQTRASMAQQQATAQRHIQAHNAAKLSPIEKTRALTATANEEHGRAEHIRANLNAQRQTNRLLATDPTNRSERAIAALRRVATIAEGPQQEQKSPTHIRNQPYRVLDDATRKQHAQADRQWQDRQAPNDQRAGVSAHLTRAQKDERKELHAQQAADHVALRGAHKIEQNNHAEWGRTLYANARKEARVQVRAALAPKWEAARALPDKTARVTAVKTLKAQQKSLYAATAEKTIGEARIVKNEGWTQMQAVHTKDRSGLTEAHALESAALTRVHSTERMAAATGAPPIPEAVTRQRDMLKALRTRITAFRNTSRFVATGAVVSRIQAERAIAALRSVTIDDHQKQQQAGAVLRGTASSTDRANAPPEARARSDRQQRADRQRQDEGSQSRSGGRSRSGGGRER